MSLVAQSLGPYERRCVDWPIPGATELVELSENGTSLAAQQAKLPPSSNLQECAAARMTALGLCVKCTEKVVRE